MFLASSWHVHDLFLICSWLSHDLFTLFLLLVHELGVSKLVHDLFMICSGLALGLLMACSWFSSLDLITIYLSLLHDFQMTYFTTCVRLLHDLVSKFVHHIFMTCSCFIKTFAWLSNGLLMVCSWLSSLSLSTPCSLLVHLLLIKCSILFHHLFKTCSLLVNVHVLFTAYSKTFRTCSQELVASLS